MGRLFDDIRATLRTYGYASFGFFALYGIARYCIDFRTMR